MLRDQEEMTRLGFYGLTPFVFGASAVWLAPVVFPMTLALFIQSMVLAYAAIIAAFLAGTGAGASLKGGAETYEPFLPRMLAALIAWFAIWPDGASAISMPAVWRYLIMITVFGWLLMRDLETAAKGGFPAWYGALRLRLTFWACVSMILIMSRLVTWRYF